MAATAAAAYWMTDSEVFLLSEPELRGELRYTEADEVLTITGLDTSANVIGLDTSAMRERLLALPSVADADVRVVLPNRVVVTVRERVPVFAMRRSDTNLLVDERGTVVASVEDDEAGVLGIPVVHDERLQWAIDTDVGGTVDPIDLAAILQLAALEPAAVGSSAPNLVLAITDDDGYVMTAEPDGWRAIFGHYTPTLRPVDLVPRQVQCLRSLLATGETDIETIYLAPVDERCGTYLPRRTPTPQPSASARM